MKKTLYSLVILAIIVVAVAAVSVSRHGSTSNAPAVVGIQSVMNSAQTAAVFGAVGANSKTVTWGSTNYPANEGVNINLIQKVADSPAQYTLVRQLAINTQNSGTYTWNTDAGETGSDLYVEVTCANASTASACQVDAQPINAN
jgi:hypothetical protein